MLFYSEMKLMELNGKNKALIAGYQKVINFICRAQETINSMLEKAGYKHDRNSVEFDYEQSKALRESRILLALD